MALETRIDIAPEHASAQPHAWCASRLPAQRMGCFLARVISTSTTTGRRFRRTVARLEDPGDRATIETTA